MLLCFIKCWLKEIQILYTYGRQTVNERLERGISAPSPPNHRGMSQEILELCKGAGDWLRIVFWAWKREDRSRETGCFVWRPLVPCLLSETVPFGEIQ